MRILLLAAVLMALAGEGTIRADVSGVSAEFEAYMLAHHYAAAQLERAGNTNKQLIEAKIDGKTVTLVFDSGAAGTVISANCSRRLHLQVVETKDTAIGIGGKLNGREGVALIQSFSIDAYPITRTSTIGVLPEGARMEWAQDGLFGLNFMRLNSVIFPVGGHGFLFKPGPAPQISIDAYMSQLGFKPIRLALERGGLFADGHLNGQPFRALVDSGSDFTNFDLAFTKKVLGHNPTFMRLPFAGVDGKERDTYIFTPASLEIEGVNLVPNSIGAAEIPGILARGASAIFGYDLLALHHAVIDTGTSTMWLK